MKIYERPICVKCKEPALCLNSGMWLCGKCLSELYNKLNEMKKKVLMEITEDGHTHR